MKKFLAGIVLSVAMVLGTAVTASAEVTVTATVCVAGGGNVFYRANGSAVCSGGMYDGADVL